jgi:hypothetical protein
MAKKDTIAALKALGITADESKTDKVLKAELKAAQPGTKQPESSAQAHLGKAERMRLQLEKQPKVAIMIPLSQGEVAGSTESVILNGYRLNIRKGEYVHVPEQVARVIMESQQQTAQAIENYFLMNAEGKSKAMKQKELNG